AVFKVHLQYGFSSIKLLAVTAAGARFGPPGDEVSLLYIACLASLVIGGSRPFSVGEFLRGRHRPVPFAAPRGLAGMRLVGGRPGNILYALRQFRQAPLFTAAAVITLALGIGGTTAIFTLIDAVMLKSLPVANPAGLWRIGEGDNCCVQGSPQDRWGFF